MFIVNHDNIFRTVPLMDYTTALTPFEPQHDKTNKMGVHPAKTDQPGYLPSLISLRCPHEESLADAQADLSLRWAHTHFVGFVMSWLIGDISSSTDFRSIKNLITLLQIYCKLFKLPLYFMTVSHTHKMKGRRG